MKTEKRPGFLSDYAQDLRRISPEKDGFHYFFGYYDNPAYSPDDSLHLCNRVPFMDRLPKDGDVNEMGVFDLKTGDFHPIAKTLAWNFQQGSMLQWFPGQKDTIVYNVWENGNYGCVVHNWRTGEQRRYGCPVANVSPDGHWGLSVNFNRIYDFRPGYGYCNRRDPFYDQPTPAGDGVTLLDFHTGEMRPLLNYEKLAELYNITPELAGAKIVINHITFNRTSDRFLFLVRYFPEQGQMWKTGLGTCDLEGNVYLLRPYTYASHYYWKDGETLLIYADGGEGPGLYELKDQTQDYCKYPTEIFHEDIHCTYSPDQNFILGDGYADEEEYRTLYLYHIPSGRCMKLARVYAPALCDFDIRSDLHCRWNHAGTHISFDSIHEGFRGLYELDVRGAMAALAKEP